MLVAPLSLKVSSLQKYFLFPCSGFNMQACFIDCFTFRFGHCLVLSETLGCWKLVRLVYVVIVCSFLANFKGYAHNFQVCLKWSQQTKPASVFIWEPTVLWRLWNICEAHGYNELTSLRTCVWLWPCLRWHKGAHMSKCEESFPLKAYQLSRLRHFHSLCTWSYW